MTKTRSGARLHTDSLVVTGRARTMACDGDYAVVLCAVCKKRLSAVRSHPDQQLYCGQKCRLFAWRRRTGKVTGRGQATKWRHVYESARSAKGAWVDIALPSSEEAKALSHSVYQKRDFESRRNGNVVSVRLMVAA